MEDDEKRIVISNTLGIAVVVTDDEGNHSVLPAGISSFATTLLPGKTLTITGIEDETD